jgi:hypothetical protein
LKPFVEITQAAARIRVELPKPIMGSAFDITGVTIRVSREGQRKPIAEYPSVYGESGFVDFLIDDDLAEAKPGWYIGVVRKCNKPLTNIRMYVPRTKLGAASVIDLTGIDDDCKQAKECPPECPKPCCVQKDFCEKEQSCS